MISRLPFRIEECTVGTGAACGAVYLDQGFETLIRKKFEGVGGRLLHERRLADILRHFDSYIKRQFNPLDPSCDTVFDISIGDIQDIPQIDICDGYMTLSKSGISNQH
jgi:hypothetical protein